MVCILVDYFRLVVIAAVDDAVAGYGDVFFAVDFLEVWGGSESALLLETSIPVDGVVSEL